MKLNRRFVQRGLVCLAAVVLSAATLAAQGTHFNTAGNILICDQFNNQVLEVNPNTNEVVWIFGSGSSVAGAGAVVAPNDAQRVGSLTLIAGTGAPAGSEPTCPNGCPDNRVLLVNPQGKITWQYGQAGVSGSGYNQLNTPVQATYLPDGTVLITDQVNERVIRVNKDLKILWQYGTTGITGTGFNQLNNPNSAELLKNGHVLIADENNNRVIEVETVSHNIVWQYGDPSNPSILNGAAFASRLPNLNTLITDSNNNRILEVDAAKNVVNTYYTNGRPGSVANPFPTRAVRLRNGNTLISDQYNDQVIEIDSYGAIVYSQGSIGIPGMGFNLLNAPYDAKVLGDYTGLTSPR